MSWSVNLIGKPANVVAALEATGKGWEGQTKVEFDAARPALVALVKQNFAKEGSGYVEPVLHFAASGSGYSANGEQLHRNCTVTLECMYATLV